VKTQCFVFLFVMLASASLLCGADDGDRTASDKRPDQTDHGPAKPQRSGHGGPTRANLPKPFPKRQTHATSAGAISPLRSPNGPSPVANGALIQNPVAGRAPLFGRQAPSPLSNLRHRSPNPAVVSGSVDLRRRNTGAISGNQVPRRP
jgi:hypothetical protein